MRLGVPDAIRGFLFDMDGVLTRTATVHAAAWKQAFDEFLQAESKRRGQTLAPFDQDHDYDHYVDGRAREDGIRAFLASRNITLADEEVHELGNRKNAIVLDKLAHGKVAVFEDTIDYVHAIRSAGLPTAVVSASANAEQVLESAGISGLFDARIDGLVAAERKLRGKPEPDMFLAGAEALGLEPARAAVFEDALAGVAAGRAGGFGIVIGVDRAGQADELRANGADLVVANVRDLMERET